MATRIRPRTAPVTGASRTWVLATDIQLITPVVEQIVSMCEHAGFSARQCRLNVPVAITEALANAMQQGNAGLAVRRVTVAVEISDIRLVVDVTDEGGGFDLEACERTPASDDWFEREDGRGVFLMRQLMDRVENHRVAAGHLLRLILHRA